MGSRREAREYALMILYQVEVAKTGYDLAIEAFFSGFGRESDLDPVLPFIEPARKKRAAPTKEAQEFAIELVRGVCEKRDEIDRMIQNVSTHWRIDRMAKVDLNILRLACFELLAEKSDVPRTVVINEAIEIAKTYGTEESAAFINGILDRM